VTAEPNKKVPGAANSERAKMLRVLIPAGAIALVVVLVAVIASMSGGARTMSDGSDGTAEDPDLKEATSGVKIRDIKLGDGKECPPGATVKVHYTGWRTDGTIFDTSKDRGPASFSLDPNSENRVIPGWQLGIPGMKVGGKRKLVISPDRGYANRPQGKIPPGSTLIFEVELLDVSQAPNVSGGPGRPMSDNSDGGTEDAGLKEIVGGLKFRDLKEGSGEPVKPGTNVTVHYTGWTVDGNVFDSSKKTGMPLGCSLVPGSPRGVIEGWQKGIPGMKPGGIRKLVIPAALAYKERGFPPDIPPGATLILEVELVSVN
jgi:peptidylprolyl isomerase